MILLVDVDVDVECISSLYFCHIEKVPAEWSPNTFRFGDAFQVNKKIFVRGLPWETTDQSLRAVFEQYGEIAEVRFTCTAYG